MEVSYNFAKSFRLFWEYLPTTLNFSLHTDTYSLEVIILQVELMSLTCEEKDGRVWIAIIPTEMKFH
jgi:hypothetical protein